MAGSARQKGRGQHEAGSVLLWTPDMQKYPSSLAALEEIFRNGGNSDILLGGFIVPNMQKFGPDNLLVEGFQLFACFRTPTIFDRKAKSISAKLMETNKTKWR